MSSETPSYQERLNRVLRHIEDRLDDSPDLDALSAVACFSPYHFHRIFTAMVGESVASYVRRLRLERAASRLSFQDLSITSVALAAGYDSVDAFTRAFRARFGVLPSEYKRGGGSLMHARSRHESGELFYHQIADVPPFEVQVRQFPPRLAAAVRYTGPYETTGPAWATLMGQLGQRNLLSADTLACGICYDNPDITPPEKCRMDVCATLPAGVNVDTAVIRELLSDKQVYLRDVGCVLDYAVIRVQGPYTLLHPAYRSLYREWLPASGREPADDPGFEVYYNSPWTVAPEQLLTEIYIPLKKC